MDWIAFAFTLAGLLYLAWRNWLRTASMPEDVELGSGLKALDELDAQISWRLVEEMAHDPEELRDYFNLMFIARHLERVGDHATNIGENAVFAAAAEDIRHRRSSPFANLAAQG